MGRSSFKNIADWMTDPVQLRRLDELVCFTQRTAFVKSIMNIDSPDGVVCTAIERSCERQGIECRFPRGKPACNINFRDQPPERRYAGSVLLKALYNTDDAGLDAGVDGALVGGELLDRMIYVYRRFLALSKITVADAPISFEHFALIRQQYALAELEFVGCDNCGSEYISGRSMQGTKCPICAAHRHAIRIKSQEPVRQFGSSALRRTA